MLKDIGNIMKLQKDFKNMQKKLKKAEADAQSPDGLVRATVNGEFELISLKIDKQLLVNDDTSGLEKTIVSTINKAISLSKEYAAKEMGKMTGGLNIPGLDKFLK